MHIVYPDGRDYSHNFTADYYECSIMSLGECLKDRYQTCIIFGNSTTPEDEEIAERRGGFAVNLSERAYMNRHVFNRIVNTLLEAYGGNNFEALDEITSEKNFIITHGRFAVFDKYVVEICIRLDRIMEAHPNEMLPGIVFTKSDELRLALDDNYEQLDVSAIRNRFMNSGMRYCLVVNSIAEMDEEDAITIRDLLFCGLTQNQFRLMNSLYTIHYESELSDEMNELYYTDGDSVIIMGRVMFELMNHMRHQF